MHLLRADANLRAKAELRPIGERGAGVDVAACGVDLAEETFGRLLTLSHDGLGVLQAVIVDLLESLVDVIDRDDGELERQVFHPVVVGLNV